MVESTRVTVLPDEVSVINVGLSLFADAVRDQATSVRARRLAHPGRRTAGPGRRPGTALRAARGRHRHGQRRSGAAPRPECAAAGGHRLGRVPRPGGVRPDAAALRTRRSNGHEVCDPLRRSMRAATVAEGWAESVEEADRILADGTVRLEPAYRHDTVMPMASAIGPSAPVFAVDNRDGGTRAFAPINQGPGETAWFGRETPAAIARLEFLRDVGRADAAPGPRLVGPDRPLRPGRPRRSDRRRRAHADAGHDQPDDPQPASAARGAAGRRAGRAGAVPVRATTCSS